MKTKFVGIINLTPDSMSQDGIHENQQAALAKIEEFASLGADFIDLGAEATSYNVTPISADEEWQRLEPILANALHFKEKIIIDTYKPEIVEKGLVMGYRYFSDVSGGQTPDYAEQIASNPDSKYILMHSTAVPANRESRIENLEQMYSWFEKKIPEILTLGVQKEQLILDPGLGFTMHPKESFELLTNLERLKSYGYPVYIGHSRKTTFDAMTDIPPKERDLETVVTSLYLYNKVDFLRVHNIPMHTRALKVWNELNKL